MMYVNIPKKSNAALFLENAVKNSKPSKIRRIIQRALRIYNVLRCKEAYERELKARINKEEKIWLLQQIEICDNNLQLHRRKK